MVSYNPESKREIDYFLPWLFDWLDFIHLSIRLHLILIFAFIISIFVAFLLYDELGIYSMYIGIAILMLGIKAHLGSLHCI